MRLPVREWVRGARATAAAGCHRLSRLIASATVGGDRGGMRASRGPVVGLVTAGLAVLALSGAPVGASVQPVKPASALQKGCPAGAVRVRIDGRVRCVTVPVRTGVAAPEPLARPAQAATLAVRENPRLHARAVLRSAPYRYYVRALRKPRIRRVFRSALRGATGAVTGTSARPAVPASASVPLGDHWQANVAKSGNHVDLKVTNGHEFWDTGAGIVFVAPKCPSAQGTAPFRFGYSFSESFRLPPRRKGADPVLTLPDGSHEKVGQRVESSLALSAHTSDTSHDTDNAHLKDFDVDLDAGMENSTSLEGASGATLWHQHVGPLRATITQPHLPVPVPSPLSSVLQRGNIHISLAAGTTLKAAEGFGDYVGTMFGAYASVAQHVYLQAQDDHWLRDCVVAAAKVEQTTLSPGQSTTLHASVKTSSGAPIAPPLMVARTDGVVVSPDRSPRGSDSFDFTVTANPDFTGGWVKIVATSASGDDSVTVPLTAAGPNGYAFAVTMTMSGHYDEKGTRTDTSSTLTRQFADEIGAINAAWTNPIFLSFDHDPLTPETDASSWATDETKTTGTTTASYTAVNDNDQYTCTAPLTGAAPPNQTDPGQEGRIRAPHSPTSAGANRLTLQPFYHDLVTDQSQQSCSQSGSGWLGTPEASFGGSGVADIASLGFDHAPFTVTATQLSRPSFTVKVTSRTGFPNNCTGYPTSSTTCTHSLDWSATLTFTRVYSCTVTTVPGQPDNWACRKG